MAMFDEQDEEDDFNGVDLGSRDVIPSVAAEIDRTLRESSFIMISINGSDDEFDPRRFGIPDYHSCGIIIWTFRTRFLTMYRNHLYETENKASYSELFLTMSPGYAAYLESEEIIALLREEAASIVARYPCMWDTNLANVVDCCLYGLFLNHYFQSTTGLVWLAHASKYWVCDGIIQGDRAWEISNTLHQELSFECDSYLLGKLLKELKEYSKIPFLVVRDDNYVNKKLPYYYCWISARRMYVTLKNERVGEDLQRIMVGASSIFLAFETTKADSPRGLPHGLFQRCSNLGVLVLSCCAFSFVSPFLHCNKLKFLGLDHCMDDNAVVELQGGGCTTEWPCLQSLLVIDLHYTDWVDILLSDKNADLMYNLIELNMEGVRCSWLATQLQKRLQCSLRRLRIIKPIYEVGETSSPTELSGSSFVDKNNLEILDLSGNRDMKILPTSVSVASHLQVLILDGCDGLENVGALPSSLKLFSLDGYGPATSFRASNIELPSESCRPKPSQAADNKDVKISMVSLEGCTQLDNLFLRGLPNLVELDLSGCAIKVLDFGAMVVDVPGLKRVFLLGCEHLSAIKWGSGKKQAKLLELLCIDTRQGRINRRPFVGAQQDKPFRIQVHAVTEDARLFRSVGAPVFMYPLNSNEICLNIKITSSTACSSRVVVASPSTSTSPSPSPYGDVFSRIGDAPTPMNEFPQPPTQPLDRHVEICDGSRNVQSEAEAEATDNPDVISFNFARLSEWYAQSLHVHDVSTYSNIMAAERSGWSALRWCRVERCSSLQAVFPWGTSESGTLETIWASDLLKAHHIWGKGLKYSNIFQSLQHLHLRSCPSLQFAVPVYRWSAPFPSLETLYIIQCGSLGHVFELDHEAKHTCVPFPKLGTIQLHDLPLLQQICDAPEMVAPALETIRIRGCGALRRLPALKGREPGSRKPAVEMEKDVWDALEWDGVDAGHHPSLFEAPLHSRYYKRPVLKGTVLR